MNETTEAQDKCQHWAYLREGTPFKEIFPTRRVPLKSAMPIVPREEGSPPCFVVDPAFLSTEQIDTLAQMLFELWRPECESIQQACEYIRQGLPLRIDWFTSVGSSSPTFFFGLMDDHFAGEEEDES